jgi:isopenicillin N synthase-like dioxygenase
VAGIPVIDVGALVNDEAGAGDVAEVAAHLDAACRDVGFFCIVGHGVDLTLLERLDTAARQFFALPESEKAEIAMDRAGHAWRGWFPLGGELTSGTADAKEGLYFGAELPAEHPLVRAGTPLHGANLFPRRPSELRTPVLAYMSAMTGLGQALLGGLALALGLERTWFDEHLTADPLVLLRIFRYPPSNAATDGWGVGEHTDYGLLTILAQDYRGGLEVRTPERWVAVDPPTDGFVCNLGDMLERVTGGRYRSTPHRVRNRTDSDRLSFPFFFDPSWDATVDRVPIVDRPPDHDSGDRWDHASVHGFSGRYGDYILAKVAKVFPDLANERTKEPRNR